MFDIMPSPMFYKNKNGVYEHCNDTFSRLILGIPKEQILGKTLYDLGHVIPKENADVYYEKDKKLFLTAKEQFYEGKVKCSDGVTRDYHFYKSSFVIDGEIIGLVGLMLDVSDYKKALLDLDAKNKLLNDLSITDSLTSLYNRRYFQDILEKK
ncbi:PAS domain-containing protein [Aliarcobacter butzleri]|nr:PAS domain-containing protein [Aliarcobacter butzleri]